MPTISISDETADKLFRDILIADYHAIKESVETLTEKQVNSTLLEYQQEDLDNDRRFLSAMQVLLTYYLPHSEYSVILKDDTV